MQVIQAIQSGRLAFAAALTGGLMVAGSASAATIDAAVYGRGQNGLNRTSFSTTNSGTAAVGMGSGATGEYRTTYEFDITSITADVLAGAPVEFGITILDRSGTPYQFALYALTADEDGAVDNSDFSAAGTFIASFNPASYANGDQLTVDVTDFVETDALAGQTYTAFRFQIAPGVDVSGNNQQANYIRFTDGTAMLTTGVIPEPASLALLGLGGVFLARRRNRA